MSPTAKVLRPYALVFPAALLYAVFIAAPLAAIVWLSVQFSTRQSGITIGNYGAILADPFYLEIFVRTFVIASLTTICAVFLGSWAALVLYRLESRWRSALLLICLAPLLISVVVRTMGWALLLGPTGLVNQALMLSGLVTAPLQFMYSLSGVVIALIHVTVPYVVISVWASLERLPKSAELAAITLGASHLTTLRRITLPLAVPGILSGTLVVFAITFGAFATPAIMGGGRVKTVATITYDEFLTTQNWPMGSALSITILLTCTVLLAGLNVAVERRQKSLA